MGKSMADIMASPDVGLPWDTIEVCLAGKLSTELQQADQELFALQSRIEVLEQEKREGEGAGAKRGRMASKPEIVKLREQAVEQAKVCDDLRARLLDHSITVRYQGTDTGAWQAFVDENPPRDKDEDKAGYVRDLRHAGLACNIDALRQVAGNYVVAYGDDAATPEMWEFVLANAVPGDLTKLAAGIVRLHEGGVDPGKSRTDWLANRRGGDDSK